MFEREPHVALLDRTTSFIRKGIRTLDRVREHRMHPGIGVKGRIKTPSSLIFSSDCLCQQSYCRGANVRRHRSSVKCFFCETVERISVKFEGQVNPLNVPKILFFPRILDFLILIIFFSIEWNPVGAKYSKRYFFHSCELFAPKLFTSGPQKTL